MGNTFPRIKRDASRYAPKKSPPTSAELFVKLLDESKVKADEQSNKELQTSIDDPNLSPYEKINALNNSMYGIKNLITQSFKDTTGVDIMTVCEKQIDDIIAKTQYITESSNKVINSQLGEIDKINILIASLRRELTDQQSIIKSIKTFVDEATANYKNIINQVNKSNSDKIIALKLMLTTRLDILTEEHIRELERRQKILDNLIAKLNDIGIVFASLTKSYTRRIELLNEKYQTDIANIHVSDYKNLYGVVESENIGFQKTKDEIINKYSVYDVESAEMTKITSRMQLLNKILLVLYMMASIYVIYIIVTSDEALNVHGMFGAIIKILLSIFLIIYPFIMPYIEWVVYNAILFIDAYLYNKVFVESNI
jgi:hypothetical protein